MRAAKVSTWLRFCRGHKRRGSDWRRAGRRQLVGGDEIDGEMVFENLDVGLGGDRGQQGAFDLAAGDVLGVENAAFGMAAFAAQVQFAPAVDVRVRRTSCPVRSARRCGPAPPRRWCARRPRWQRPAPAWSVSRTWHFEGILLAGDGGDAALGVIGVGFGAGFLGDNGDAAERRDFQGEGKAGDAAAEDKKVEIFHWR